MNGASGGATTWRSSNDGCGRARTCARASPPSARAGRSTHAETGPGERLPVGTALRKADEWGPGRRALDAHVLAVDVHEPGASAVALEHEFQGCLRRQAVLQLPLEAGDLRAQVRDSLAQAVRDVLSQEGRRLEGRRTLSHWQPRAEPGARRDR